MGNMVSFKVLFQTYSFLALCFLIVVPLTYYYVYPYPQKISREKNIITQAHNEKIKELKEQIESTRHTSSSQGGTKHYGGSPDPGPVIRKGEINRLQMAIKDEQESFRLKINKLDESPFSFEKILTYWGACFTLIIASIKEYKYRKKKLISA